MTKTTKIDEFQLPIFDGTDYNSWKFRFLTILKFKKGDQPAKRKIDVSVDKDIDAWNETDLKAQTLLICSASNRQLEYIKNFQTTLHMIEQLDKMYLNNLTALQILARNKLDELRMKNFSSIEEFFVNFEQNANKLIEAGGTLKEDEKINYLLKALPSDYSYIGDFIDIVPEEQKTFDYV